jgi:hypothetical protein
MSFVTNPLTNRAVRIGGKAYKQLVAKKLIEDHPNSTVAFQSDEKSELELAKKIMISQKLYPDKDISIRGDKLIKSNKKVSGKEMTARTAKAGSSVFSKIKNNQIDIPNDVLDDEEKLAGYLEQLILQETVNPTQPPKKILPIRKQAPKKRFKKLPMPETETEFNETTEFETTCAESSESE